ncbi:MAG: endonuclease [Bacteroidales bacterium]|nr:endonuclease [Bacteroidales bacterium]
MKTRILLLLLTITTTVFSQKTPSYYSTAYNTQGEDLRNKLNDIIKGHTEFTYTSSSTDVWDILKETDKDPENPENVILFYSNVSVNGEQEYNNAQGWTREHVWAKSRGDFGTTRGPGTDVHHLRPASLNINSSRSNKNFKDCIDCNYLEYQGSPSGASSTTEYTYEPNDNVKGDVARMIFYMALRYEGENGEPNLEIIDYLLNKEDKMPLHALLSTLMEWNKLDTVSAFEMNRNDIIFNDYQHNRNPFIDYPGLADYIYGSMTDQFWNPHHLAVDDEEISRIMVFSNSTTNSITIKNARKWQLEVYNPLGQLLTSATLASENETLNLPYSDLIIIKLTNGIKVFSQKMIL